MTEPGAARHRLYFEALTMREQLDSKCVRVETPSGVKSKGLKGGLVAS